jgi:hypothetical protein
MVLYPTVTVPAGLGRYREHVGNRDDVFLCPSLIDITSTPLSYFIATVNLLPFCSH